MSIGTYHTKEGESWIIVVLSLFVYLSLITTKNNTEQKGRGGGGKIKNYNPCYAAMKAVHFCIALLLIAELLDQTSKGQQWSAKRFKKNSLGVEPPLSPPLVEN